VKKDELVLWASYGKSRLMTWFDRPALLRWPARYFVALMQRSVFCGGFAFGFIQ
jgi:hypothetical protein